MLLSGGGNGFTSTEDGDSMVLDATEVVIGKIGEGRVAGVYGASG